MRAHGRGPPVKRGSCVYGYTRTYKTCEKHAGSDDMMPVNRSLNNKRRTKNIPSMDIIKADVKSEKSLLFMANEAPAPRDNLALFTQRPEKGVPCATDITLRYTYSPL